MDKIKQWIVSHKLISIIIASVLTVGIALSVALPLALSHKHTFSEDWTAGEETHWHACTGEGCDEKSDETAHVFRNNEINIDTHKLECSDCGYVTGELAHEYEVRYDEFGHWETCTGCENIINEAGHNFVSRTEGAQKLKVCSDCGYSIVTSISEERFENAMALKDENGNYYTNFDMLYMNGEGNKVRQYKVTENAAYKYGISSDSNNLETVWTNENGKDVIYTKYNAESKWRREQEETTDMNFANRILPLTSLFLGQENITYDLIKDSYNESDFAYHVTYPISSYSMAVALYFEGGKLVKISYEITISSSSSLTGTRTITYGNAEINIPSESESVIKVNFDETAYTFTTIENVNLVAGEAKWFKVELDDTKHSTSKVGSGYELSGSFTTTADGNTITITAEKEDHTPITNDAAAGSKLFSFDELSDGVYFIKITATENCTGSFSIAFAS